MFLLLPEDLHLELIISTVASVLPWGGRKTSPRKSSEGAAGGGVVLQHFITAHEQTQ